MLRSVWLSYYYAICYSPLVAKSFGFENQNNGAWSCFISIRLKLFYLDISEFDQLRSWILLKQLFLSPSRPIAYSASWAIDLEE